NSAAGFPSLSGIILNGGFTPPETIARLVEGLDQRLPIVATDLGTFRSASAAYETRGMVTKDAELKVAAALALFEQHVAGDALLDHLQLSRTDVVTPLMFEYELLDRARNDRKHI